MSKLSAWATPVAITVLPIITSPALPPAVVGSPYSATMQGTSGTWSATGLPSGLSMSAAGVITGTPTTAGVSTASVTLVDALANSTTAPYTISVQTSGVRHPIIDPFVLADAVVGVAFSQTLTGEAGTWSAINLPAGLSMGAGGTISGTPTTAGQYSPIIELTSGALVNLVAASMLVTTSGTAPELVTGSLAEATIGTAYSQGLSATGSTPITWAVTGLPADFTYSPSTGTITCASPSIPGVFSITITAHNATGNSEPKTMQLLVREASSSTGTSAWAQALKGQR